MKKFILSALMLLISTPTFGVEISEESKKALKIECPEDCTLQYLEGIDSLPNEFSKDLSSYAFKSYYLWGKYFSFCRDSNGLLQGGFKAIDNTDDVIITGRFKDSLFHGEWVHYGQYFQREIYQEGEMSCWSTYTYENGDEEEYFKDWETCYGDEPSSTGRGRKVISVLKWHKNGMLSYSCQEGGRCFGWWPDGTRSHVLDEGVIGYSVRWYEDGTFEEATYCYGFHNCVEVTEAQKSILKFLIIPEKGWEKEPKKKTKKALNSCRQMVKKIKKHHKKIRAGEKVDYDAYEKVTSEYQNAIDTLISVELELQEYTTFTIEDHLEFSREMAEACSIWRGKI